MFFGLFHILARNISAEGHFGQNFLVIEHFGHGSFWSGNISVMENPNAYFSLSIHTKQLLLLTFEDTPALHSAFEGYKKSKIKFLEIGPN